MRFISIIILFVASSLTMNAQLISVKTNALQDVLMTPNLGVDLVVGERTSVGVSVLGNYKPYGKEMKMIGVTPELRYWLGRPMSKFFVGISGLAAVYDITTDGKVYKGDAFGGGLTFGYDFYLSQHWSMELHGGCGAAYYTHHRYYVGDNYISKKHNEHGYALVPYNVGLSFIYIIK